MIKKTLRKIMSWSLYLLRDNHAVQNFILWPLSNKLLRKKYSETVNIGGGMKMKLFLDVEDMVVRTLLFYSPFVAFAWEPMTTKLFQKLLPDKKSIVIAGAHLGYYPITAAHANPHATVHAFEPVSLMYERFAENMRLNNLINVLSNQKALSGNIGTSLITVDGGASTLLAGKRRSTKTESVQTITLDAYLDSNATPPDLILLDVEGYEEAVLRGGIQTIKKTKPDIIFEINNSYNDSLSLSQTTLVTFLEELGYSVYVIQDDYSHLRVFNKPKNIRLIRVENFGDSTISPHKFVNCFATVNNKLSDVSYD